MSELDQSPGPYWTHRVFACATDDIYQLFQTGFDVAYGYPRGGTTTALADDAPRHIDGRALLPVKHSQLAGEKVRLGAAVFAAGGNPLDIAQAQIDRQELQAERMAIMEANRIALAEWELGERDGDGFLIEPTPDMQTVPELPVIAPIDESIAALEQAGAIEEIDEATPYMDARADIINANRVMRDAWLNGDRDEETGELIEDEPTYTDVPPEWSFRMLTVLDQPEEETP